MSGHSKWAQIKRQKGATDQKRSALFTKLGNTISVAARQGGGDIETNFKLRLAVDKAKSANMPKDNIERAIKRGTGELAGGQLEEIIYEGYGPGGIAIYVEALADNKNRAVAALKYLLSKYGGNLATSGSVVWMFERKGVLRILIDDIKISLEELELKAIDAGAEDTRREEDCLVVYSKADDLSRVKEQLEQSGIKVEYAEIEMVAKERIAPDEANKAKLEKLYEELDENPDVSNYYTNEE